jgi:hypothetical protein
LTLPRRVRVLVNAKSRLHRVPAAKLRLPAVSLRHPSGPGPRRREKGAFKALGIKVRRMVRERTGVVVRGIVRVRARE